MSFKNQTSDGTSVVVDSVTMPEGGFISTHDERFVADGDGVAVGAGSIIGYSEYLDPGTHSNVTVELFNNSKLDTSPYEDGRLDKRVQTLIVLPHEDTNGDEEWDFYPGETREDGAYKQGPQSDDNVPLERITDTAKIVVPANEDKSSGSSGDDDGSDENGNSNNDNQGHSHGQEDDDTHSHDDSESGSNSDDDHDHGS